MRLVALGLISVLLLAPTPGAGSPNHVPEQPAVLVLTNEHPTGDFPIAPEIFAASPPILALRVKSVINPSQLGIHLLVYLVVDSRTGGSKKMLLGDVGFYPPGHPSGFLLRSSNAFAELNSDRKSVLNPRLSLELARIHPENPWAKVAITVSPPQWQNAVHP